MAQTNETLQVVNETATLEKRDRITGRVRVRTTTQTVDELVSSVLERSDVEVTRVAIGRDIDTPPSVRNEDGVMIIPVVEEILVVEKRLVLREEIHVRTITTSQSVEVPVTLRKQRAAIERDVLPTTESEEET